MSVQLISIAPSMASDAAFRAWGKAISDALTAIGITKTADTGQINWATVTKPSTASTYAGYEIRQFTDSLQSSNPVILKFSYGSGEQSTYPALMITIGRASDGAGALTGDVTSDMVLRCGNTSTTAYNSWINGDTGWLSMCLFYNAGANFTQIASIERLHDDTGADTDAGVQAVWMGGPSSTYFHRQTMLPKSGTVYGYFALQSALPASGTGAYGANVGVFPIFPNLGYAGNPCLGSMLYFTGDIPAGTSMAIPMYGTNHTYITTGINSASTQSINGNTTSHSLMIRYE